MLVSLYTSLNERRREMSVLRAIGAGPLQIVLLLVLESALLACAGASLGVALVYSARPVIGNHFGLYLSIQSPTEAGYAYLGSVIVLGTLIGFLPAIKAYRNSLADGLSIRL